MNTPSHTFTLLKLYRTLVSLAGIIGITIGFGIFLYTLVNQFVITNDEYLVSMNVSWRFDQCKQSTYNSDNKEIKKTEQEIKDCEIKERNSALIQRSIESKEALIWSLIRGTVFLILFLTHYPALVKNSDKS